MCGIYGQFNPGGADPQLIERMARCLRHRGPDGRGAHHDGALAFGAGRLAIIDLAAGVQPIFSEDRRVAVVYNGEIYNHRALRADLEARGHVFATRTDTEVLVHGYEAWGAEVISRLRGMFALGLWDQGAERLLLARDRLGEKPLYYARVGENFLFASEAKALFEHAALRPAINPEALLHYLVLGYVPPPHTLFAGIDRLAPGEMLLVHRHGIHRERFWQAEMDTTTAVGFDEAVRRVRETLTEAVEMRLMGDVPVGAYLSGGLDSTAVVAIMSRALGRPVQTFTVGFDFEAGSAPDAKFNVDARHAARTAAFLGADHHAITVRQDESLAEIFPHLVYALDEPLAQQSVVQTAFVAALARANGVPVLLSGDASDELFAGYPHYQADRVLDRYLRLPGWLRQGVIAPLAARLPGRFGALRALARKADYSDAAGRYLEWMRMIAPAELPALMRDDDRARTAQEAVGRVLNPLLAAPRTAHFADRIAYASLNLWIAEDSNMRVDKMTMLMSTEARAPFEDHRLVELALRLPLAYKLRGGDFKAVLKHAVADLVPPEVLARPKWGFNPPASDWLRTALRPLVETYLSREYVGAVGLFDPDTVWGMVEAHRSKARYERAALWTLLVFHLWHALYIDGSLTLPHRLTPADLTAAGVVRAG